MKTNHLYFIIGVLAVTTAVLGYLYYQERYTSRVEISVDKKGISIQGN